MRKTVPCLLVLAVAAFLADTSLTIASAARPTPLHPTILGNPTISSVSAPAPAGPVGASVPTQVPKGPAPATHVYIKAGGGNAATFAAMEFQLPVGLRQPTITLSVQDDAAPAEDVHADTAPLYACVMPSSMFAGDPDGAVNYDCTLPGKGLRSANAAGGAWTFDVSPLASTADRHGRFGLAIVSAPDPAAAFSVSVLRSSVSLTVIGGAAADRVGPTQPLDPVGRVSPVASIGTLPSTPAVGVGLVSGPLAALTGPAPADALAPDVASAPGGSPQDVVLAAPRQILPAASSSTSAHRWRPLLLLLVPLVPVAGLALLRRLDPEGDDPEALAELYPGLASLRS